MYDNDERDDIIQLVCFELGSEEYAIDVLSVREVIHIPEITRVAQMATFVRGVINIRGNIIPVFDLRRKFKLEEKEFDECSRILVVMIGTELIGLIVDQVLETLRLDKNMIDPVPPVRMAIDRECIIGIGKLTERMIIIIDIQKLNEFIVQDIQTFSEKIKRSEV